MKEDKRLIIPIVFMVLVFDLVLTYGILEEYKIVPEITMMTYQLSPVMILAIVVILYYCWIMEMELPEQVGTLILFWGMFAAVFFVFWGVGGFLLYALVICSLMCYSVIKKK